MSSHPGIIADMIASAARAAGATVGTKQGDEHCRYGYVVITMPDGLSYEIKIEETD